MKKILFLFLGFLISHCAFPHDFVVGKLAYNVINLDSLTCEVAPKPGNYSGSIVIPDTVNYQGRSFTVKAIGEDAFCYSTITSIVIPKSITQIKKSAFSDSRTLASITIPESVTSIGNYCFSGSKFLRTVKLPNSLLEIGTEAFCGCNSLVTITLPQNIKVLRNRRVFAECKQLRKVIFPDGFTELGIGTFQGCGFSTFQLPSSLEIIGEYCFKDCPNLTTISIPNSVREIGAAAFTGCKLLSNISLSDNLTQISDWCFEGCNSLKSITFPQSVIKVSSSAFQDCIQLRTVKMGDHVKSIEQSAFSGCTALTSINFCDSITSFGVCAFRKCENLKSFHTPNQLKEIEQRAFGYVDPSIIILPKGFKYLGCEPWSRADTVIIRYNEKPFYWDNSSFGAYAKNLWINRDYNSRAVGSFYRIENLIIGPYKVESSYVWLLKEDYAKTLTSLFQEPPSIKEVSNNLFLNLVVYVPKESIDQYKAHPMWGKFWNIQSIPDDKMAYYNSILEMP